MTTESPLRAQPDNRIAHSGNQYQASLFDEPQAQNGHHEQLLADYRQRYGLAEDPFADDFSFPFFTGGGRRQILDRLLHLCQFSNSLLVVLGDYGVGKTRLAHALMDSLPEDDGLSYLPIKARQGTDELLTAIVEDLELGVEGESVPSRDQLLAALEQFMLVDPLEDDSLAVVVIDNAQLLSQDFLQTLFSLLKKHPKQNRLHLVMLGEPALMEQLENCDMDGVLLNDFYVQPFTLGESVDYLNFRMEMADYLGPEIFTESMVNPWWRQAQGQLSLLHDLAQERLLESVTSHVESGPKRGLPVMHIVAISVLITLVGILLLYMGDDEPQVQALSKPQLIVSAPSKSTPDLTKTATPVEPLMQTLPEPAAVGAAPITEERIVPLAEISSRPATGTSQPVPAVVNPAAEVVVPATNTAVVAIQPQPVEQPKFEEKPKVVAEPVKSLPAVTKPAVAEIPVIASSAKTAQEKTILSWPATNYTIQLLGVSTEKAARDYAATQSNKNDLLVFETRRQGKPWFVVITGRYPNAAQARQAIASLPTTQRDAGPWPRELKVIQQEIKSVP